MEAMGRVNIQDLEGITIDILLSNVCGFQCFALFEKHLLFCFHLIV